MRRVMACLETCKDKGGEIMKIKNLTLRDQMRAVGNVCGAWLCGAGLGLWLGFGDFGGVVWYDLRAGVALAVGLGAVFALSAIFCAVFDTEPDEITAADVMRWNARNVPANDNNR